jgi:hypothetical protein
MGTPEQTNTKENSTSSNGIGAGMVGSRLHATTMSLLLTSPSSSSSSHHHRHHSYQGRHSTVAGGGGDLPIRRLFFVMIGAGLFNSLWMLYTITSLGDYDIKQLGNKEELLSARTYQHQGGANNPKRKRQQLYANGNGNGNGVNVPNAAQLLLDEDNLYMDYYHSDEFIEQNVDADTPIYDLPQHLMEFAAAKQAQDTSTSSTDSIWDTMQIGDLALPLPSFLSSGNGPVSVVKVATSDDTQEKEENNSNR